MRHRRYASLAAAFALASLLSNPVVAGVRAFVASTGNDANTASQCGPTTPCRGFTAAMSVVDPNGEIIALDAAGYGAVTVTKSVSIIANPGVYAGVAASAGVAITIATASVNVVLRGLNINNIGTATTGISMTNGSRLVIDNCVISNFTSTGVNVTVGAEVRIIDSTIRDNDNGVQIDNGATAAISGSRFAGHTIGTGALLVLQSAGSGTTTAAVSDSVFSGNWVGVYVCAGSGTSRASLTRSTIVNNHYGVATDACGGTQTAVVSNNLVTGNVFGLFNGGGTIQSLGNNTGGQNLTPTSGTITAVSGF